MSITLRKLAKTDTNLFHFIQVNQKIHTAHQGCTGVRELAKIWWRINKAWANAPIKEIKL
jgi:hypothetical protein